MERKKKNEKKINPNDIWLVSSEVKASHVENRVGTALWGRKTGWASSSPGCNYLLKTKQNKKKCTCEYTPLKTDTYLTSEVSTFGFTMTELTVLFRVSAASRYGHIQLAGLSNDARSLKRSKARPLKTVPVSGPKPLSHLQQNPKDASGLSFCSPAYTFKKTRPFCISECLGCFPILSKGYCLWMTFRQRDLPCFLSA